MPASRSCSYAASRSVVAISMWNCLGPPHPQQSQARLAYLQQREGPRPVRLHDGPRHALIELQGLLDVVDVQGGALERELHLRTPRVSAGLGSIALVDHEKRTTLFGRDAFAYDAEKDLYTCPQGELLRRQGYDHRERSIRYAARPSACKACSLKVRCTKSIKGRWIRRSFDEEYLERARGYRDTEPYRKAISKRAVWVEPLFGEAKDWHGSRRFRLRTFEKVNAEALLIAAGQNIKRLLTFWGKGPRHLAAALRPPAQTSLANSRLARSHRRRSSRLLASFSTRWLLLGTDVKIALGRLHFHGLGVTRLGPWITSVKEGQEEGP
jgi:hypothetical protein